jgi:hypothetical protein
MQFAYGLSEVIDQIPKLEHRTWIYIHNAEASYQADMDDGVWTLQPDLHAKPYIPLYICEGGGKYRFYEILSVGHDEWE